MSVCTASGAACAPALPARPPAGLPELPPGEPDYFYPQDVIRAVAVAIPVNILLLFGTLYLSLRCALALLAALPSPLQLPALVLCGAWVAASFAQAWVPVQAVEEEERRAAARAAKKAAAAAAGSKQD